MIDHREATIIGLIVILYYLAHNVGSKDHHGGPKGPYMRVCVTLATGGLVYEGPVWFDIDTLQS